MLLKARSAPASSPSSSRHGQVARPCQLNFKAVAFPKLRQLRGGDKGKKGFGKGSTAQIQDDSLLCIHDKTIGRQNILHHESAD